MSLPVRRAIRSLEGLSLGDAFGELFFELSPFHTPDEDLPKGPWPWTDDTAMALSVVDILHRFGAIDQDALADAFARRFEAHPGRGYGGGAFDLLERFLQGHGWRTEAPRLFDGGSYGNGGAMRAAPIGGYFADDPERAASEGLLSAAVTHAHPEGQAGASAVACAAALAASTDLAGISFIDAVLDLVPEGETRDGIQESLSMDPRDPRPAARELGSGYRISAQDTVPFCIWAAAFHLHDYRAALRFTVRGQGDVDTTCAIVGGIVALRAPDIPPEWLALREPLPRWVRRLETEA